MTRSAVFAWTPLLLCLLAVPLPAAEIHVPEDQPTIQAGIDTAVDGDTVLVGPGTYYESIDISGKGIVVRSAAGPEQTLINGPENGDRAVYFITGEDARTVLEGFTILNTPGGGILCENASPTITGNIIRNNGSTGGYYAELVGGGGISSHGGSPTISKNSIFDNRAVGGGGISCTGAALIVDNWIFDNSVYVQYGQPSGGGIYAGFDVTIIGNVIENNSCTSAYGGGHGGGIYRGGLIEGNVFLYNSAEYGRALWKCSGTVRNNLFVTGNLSCDDLWPGMDRGELIFENNVIQGIATAHSNQIVVTNSIITGSIEISQDATLDISYSNLVGGEQMILVNGDATYNWGPGMISADPLFVSGPLGEYYLSQVAAGQAVDSPCVDAGDPATDIPFGVTRTDGVPDSGTIDMGYHYPALGIVAGPGPSELNAPRIRVFSVSEYPQVILDSNAYGAPGYGVNVTLGDPDGDQRLEILTGPGPGDIYGPHIRGFESDGTPMAGLSFMAYGTHKFGANVIAGDLNGNGRDEIITGAGPGAVFGPHVRAFSYTSGGGVSSMPGVSFFAYNTLKWGVNVAAGDIDGDSFDEIVTGAGPGTAFGPHVRGWNVDGGTAAVIPNMGFMAYAVNKYGVNVCCADVNGDGVDEIVTGPGPTGYFPSHIRGWRWDGTETTALPGFSFFAWPPEEASFGARVGRGADMDHDGRDELIVSGGPDPDIGTPVKVFRYADNQITEWFAFEAFPAGWTHGANAAGGWLR